MCTGDAVLGPPLKKNVVVECLDGILAEDTKAELSGLPDFKITLSVMALSVSGFGIATRSEPAWMSQVAWLKSKYSTREGLHVRVCRFMVRCVGSSGWRVSGDFFLCFFGGGRN